MTTDLATVRDAAEWAIRQGYLSPHQGAALSALDAQLSEKQREDFSQAWRAQGSPAAPVAPAQPLAIDPAIILSVPYLSQRDSATAQGDRMCFASTCAMAVEWLKPGCLAGAGQPDDRYLALLQQFGDTTDAQAHVRLVHSLGFPTARFGSNGAKDLLVAELRAGRPVAVGWLHHGPVARPSGGGHWSLVVGWEPGPDGGTLVIHDPFGEADLRSGGYALKNCPANPDAGRFQRYSWRNWSQRWMVDGPGSGWFIKFN